MHSIFKPHTTKLCKHICLELSDVVINFKCHFFILYDVNINPNKLASCYCFARLDAVCSKKFFVFCQDWSGWPFWQEGSSHQHGDWGWQADPEGHRDILQHRHWGDAHECGWSYLENHVPFLHPILLILEFEFWFLYYLNPKNFFSNSSMTFLYLNEREKCSH